MRCLNQDQLGCLRIILCGVRVHSKLVPAAALFTILPRTTNALPTGQEE
jgi:hypothetical protein